LTGNYNKIGYDRTKWYTINNEIFLNRFFNIDKTNGKSICQKGKSISTKGQIDLNKRANGFVQNGKPIPVINTDVNTNINTIPEAGETAFSEETAEQLLPKDTFTNKQDKLTKTKKVMKESNEPAAPVKVLNDMFAGLLETNLPGAQYSFKIGGSIFQRLLKTNSIEKLQDISEEDAIKEGIEKYGPFGEYKGEPHPRGGSMKFRAYKKAARAFQDIWESIYPNHPTKAWELNPYVWVITFEKVNE
jgi:hypothetical protein